MSVVTGIKALTEPLCRMENIAMPESEFGGHGQDFRHEPESEADLNTETRFSDSSESEKVKNH